MQTTLLLATMPLQEEMQTATILLLVLSKTMEVLLGKEVMQMEASKTIKGGWLQTSP